MKDTQKESPKALYMRVKHRSYDNKYMVWGEYPIDKVTGFEDEPPFTSRYPVLVPLLAFVADSREKALDFMKENLRK